MSIEQKIRKLAAPAILASSIAAAGCTPLNESTLFEGYIDGQKVTYVVEHKGADPGRKPREKTIIVQDSVTSDTLETFEDWGIPNLDRYTTFGDERITYLSGTGGVWKGNQYFRPDDKDPVAKEIAAEGRKVFSEASDRYKSLQSKITQEASRR
jgi:hypothetical protein